MIKGFCEIWSPEPSSVLIACIPEVNGLYNVATAIEVAATTHSSHTCMSLRHLHECMGHMSFSSTRTMVSNGMVEGIEIASQPDDNFCETCVKAKITHDPFPAKSNTCATKYGEWIHTDVWGPARVASLQGKLYYVSFTNDFSRETTVIFVKKKSLVFAALQDHIQYVLNQCDDTKVRHIRCDRGGEYLSNDAKGYFANRGIQLELTVHDSPQQNGVAERANCTLIEHARTLLIGANLLRTLWAEAVSHATYLKNCSPTRTLINKTPYEMVHGCKPNLSDLHRFKCKVFVQLENTGKLDEQAKEAKLVGYDLQSKGYRIYWPETCQVSVERNICFAPEEVSQTTGNITQTPDIVEFEGESEIVDLETMSSNLPEPSPANIPLPLPPLTTPPSSLLSRQVQIMPVPPSAVPAPRHPRKAASHQPGFYASKSFPPQHANAMWEVELAADKEFYLDIDAVDAVKHTVASIENDEPSVNKALQGPNTDK